jgi:hypothetical protein
MVKSGQVDDRRSGTSITQMPQAVYGEYRLEPNSNSIETYCIVLAPVLSSSPRDEAHEQKTSQANSEASTFTR